MQDARRGNLWVWVGVAVVVIAVILFFVWKPQPYTPSTSTPSTTGNPAPVYAPQGQVVSGFPQQLLLDNSSQISSSYSISYSSSTNQYTAQWSSSTSLQDLYQTYKTYLQANGWTITNDMSSGPDRGLYAVNASNDVLSVLITPNSSGGINVVAGYVAQ